MIMTKFAVLNTDNFPVAFYAPEIHGENIPAEAVEITDEQWHELLAHQGRRKLIDGEVVEYTPPTPLPGVDDYKAAIVALLDAKAQERRYDNAVSIATYIGSKRRLDWKAEAEAFVDWRDEVWDYAYAEFDKVSNGERPQPTVEAFIAELPEMKWPA